MSQSLLNMLQGQLGEGLIDQLSQQIGTNDREKTAAATTGILSTLLSGLAKNASTTEGATALNNALDRDHDGSVLDDFMDIIAGNKQAANERALNGQGIIQHILGDKQGGAIDMISRISGLDSGKTGNLMSMIAPLLMGTLGKTKKTNGLDMAGLASLLSGTVTEQSHHDPNVSLISRFLDSDGDGSVVDDITNIGMRFLGGLFKK